MGPSCSARHHRRPLLALAVVAVLAAAAVLGALTQGPLAAAPNPPPVPRRSVAPPPVPPPRGLPPASRVGTTDPFAVVLGIAQDGGYPQAGTKESAAWDDPAQRRLVASLGLVDPQEGRRWLVDCTPDFPQQLQRLDRIAPSIGNPGLGGILLTHAHVGHYAGLIHLGREAMGANAVPVYAMPRMAQFLRGNGPWELLLRLSNVVIAPLAAGEPVRLNERLTATPLLVPHRDEYSETVAFRIAGPKRALLWLPDIDKWEKWDAQGTKLEEVLAGVDVAYLDGTFFADGEVPGRSMAEIPHPFVRETIARLAPLRVGQRNKVRFVHLNRTNPLVRSDAAARAEVEAAGMAVAEEGEQQPL